MSEVSSEEILVSVYNETYEDIFKYILSKCRNIDDVGDLVQNTYLNFYRALSNKNIKDYKKYLIRIARNEVYRHYGILKLSQNFIPIFFSESEEEFFNLKTDLKVEHNYDEKLLCDSIWKYLKDKDSLTLKIFILYFNKDLKIKDIANILKVNESTVKNRLYRTMKEINKEFNL